MDVETYNELSSAFTRSRSFFDGKESETNWSQREKFLNHARSIVQKIPENQTTRLDCGIDGLQDAILKGVNSLRTTLSSTGCLLMQDMASRCGENLHHSFNIEILLQHFIKLCFNTKVITRDMGSDTVIAIITNAVYHVRFMQHIHNTLQDKNPAPRRLACQWLRKLIKHHSGATVERAGGLDLIETCLNMGLNDRDQLTREAMRPTFWAFARRWPDKWERILEGLDKIKQQQLVADPSNPYPNYRETHKANLANNNKTSAFSQSTGSMSSKPVSIKDVKAKLAAQKKAAKTQERPLSAGSHHPTKQGTSHHEDPRLTPSTIARHGKPAPPLQISADLPAPPTATRPRSRHNISASASYSIDNSNPASAKMHKARNTVSTNPQNSYDTAPPAPPKLGNLASAPVRPRKANPTSRQETREMLPNHTIDPAPPTSSAAEASSKQAVAALETIEPAAFPAINTTAQAGNAPGNAQLAPQDAPTDASVYRPPATLPLREPAEGLARSQPFSDGMGHQTGVSLTNGTGLADPFESPLNCRKFLEIALSEIRKQTLDVNGFRKLQLLTGSQPSSSTVWEKGNKLTELLEPLLSWLEFPKQTNGRTSSATPVQILMTLRLIIYNHGIFCSDAYSRILSTILLASQKYPAGASISNGLESIFELIAERCELRPAVSVLVDVLDSTAESNHTQQRALSVLDLFLQAATRRSVSVLGDQPLDDELARRLGKTLSTRCSHGNAPIRNAAIQSVVALRRALDMSSGEFEALVPLHPPQRELMSYYLSRQETRA